jgi:hypothetical protein
MYSRLLRASGSRRAVFCFAAVGLVTSSSQLKPFLLESHPIAVKPILAPTPAIVSPVSLPSPISKKTTLLDLLAPEWLHWLAAMFATIADAVVGEKTVHVFKKT